MAINSLQEFGIIVEDWATGVNYRAILRHEYPIKLGTGKWADSFSI